MSSTITQFGIQSTGGAGLPFQGYDKSSLQEKNNLGGNYGFHGIDTTDRFTPSEALAAQNGPAAQLVAQNGPAAQLVAQNGPAAQLLAQNGPPAAPTGSDPKGFKEYFEAYRDYMVNAGSYAVPYSEFAGAIGVIPDAVKVGLIGWSKKHYEEAIMNSNENNSARNRFEEQYWYHIYTSFQTGKFSVPPEAQQMQQG